MKRTTIMLPEEMKSRAMKRANIMGVSLGCFIREALERSLQNSNIQSSVYEHDPFFSDDSVFKGKTPGNLSIDHDDYLYGDNN